MAVQQNRKTRSKRGMRRAHDALTAKALSIEPNTGETHLRQKWKLLPERTWRTVATALKWSWFLQPTQLR